MKQWWRETSCSTGTTGGWWTSATELSSVIMLSCSCWPIETEWLHLHGIVVFVCGTLAVFVGLSVFAFYNLSIGYVRRYTSTHSQTDILSFKHAFPLSVSIDLFHTSYTFLKQVTFLLAESRTHNILKMKLTNIGTKSALRQAILNEVTCPKAIDLLLKWHDPKQYLMWHVPKQYCWNDKFQRDKSQSNIVEMTGPRETGPKAILLKWHVPKQYCWNDRSQSNIVEMTGPKETGPKAILLKWHVPKQYCWNDRSHRDRSQSNSVEMTGPNETGPKAIVLKWQVPKQ